MAEYFAGEVRSSLNSQVVVGEVWQNPTQLGNIAQR